MNTAIVVGGGRGIGAAVCRVLATSERHGIRRIIIAQRRPPEERFLQGLMRSDLEIAFLRLDITDRTSRENFVHSVPDRLHYLVHCAGLCPRENFLEMTEEIWEEVVAVTRTSPLSGSMFMALATCG